MLASTLSRPRCAMPMPTSSRPFSAAFDRIASSSGMSASPPSSEKRFCPTNFVCRNVSNASAELRRRRMRSWSSRGVRAYPDSRRSWSHLRCVRSARCMYSTPTVRQ
ncbi:Uncharacterised protein [Mycobacteroides abscessus]|nr:Uncharacterised protein [Mycobacteroides abscessus]